jgi:hypothetical protein
MKNTSQILIPRADIKVDQITLCVIREIHKASKELGFEVFIVGAIARIILLEYVFGLSMAAHVFIVIYVKLVSIVA